MNKIKVVQIITRLDKGGSSELALNLSRKMDPERFITVLVYGQNRLAAYSTEGVTCVYIPQLKRELSPLNDLLALLKIYRLLRKERPDIVQTNSSKAGFVGRWAAWLYNLAEGRRGGRAAMIIHMPHGHVFYGYGFDRVKTALFLSLERLTAKITKKMVAITEGEKIESLSFGIGVPGQWEMIHPGVETAKPLPAGAREAARKELGIPAGAVVAGTVARLEPVKGVRYLVEAAAQMSKRAGVRFLVVGGGSQQEMLESYVSTLGLKDKFIFTGMSDNVNRLMPAMDIFVQPSLNEGMGKTLVQAHSLGLPVVATDVQGIPDVVIDGKTGFLVPPADAASLAEKIVRLAESSELRKKMGEAGRDWVTGKVEGLARFSEERAVRQFEKLYENIIRQ